MITGRQKGCRAPCMPPGEQAVGASRGHRYANMASTLHYTSLVQGLRDRSMLSSASCCSSSSDPPVKDLAGDKRLLPVGTVMGGAWHDGPED